MSRQQVADHEVEALMSAARALVGLAVLSLSELGERLSLGQFRAVLLLAEVGTLKAHDLAERLGVSASSVTRLCDRLVADGLIERVANPHNRREVLLTATARGRRLVGRVLDRRRRDLLRVLDELSDADRTAAVTALERFAAHADDLRGADGLAEWPVR